MTSANDSERPRHEYGFEVVRRTNAPPELVWALVGVASRWKEWTWMTRTFLTREGVPEPDGVGALRRFGVGPFGSIEEVVAWEPPSHLGYESRKGIPVRRYRADVHLEVDGTGTKVRWEATLVPLLPGTGAVVAALLRWVIAGFTKRLCVYADRQVAQAGRNSN